MKTKLNITTNKAEDEELHTLTTLPPQPKREIYPEANDRFKGVFLWLGFAFVVMVFWVQHFSGYA
jgi:hypothetical protein